MDDAESAQKRLLGEFEEMNHAAVPALEKAMAQNARLKAQLAALQGSQTSCP
jgi:hypothetical protein